MNIEDSYKIIYDDKNPKKWCVQLQESCDPFHDILYSYGEFSLKVDSDADVAIPKFNFEIDILYVPERLRGVEFPDDKEIEMENLIAQILLDIIGKNSDCAKNRDGKLYLELSRDIQ